MKHKLTKEEILANNDLTPQEQYKYYMKTSEWQSIRIHVLNRDNFTCKCCNRTQTEIDAYNTKKGKNLLSLVVHHCTYQNLFNEVETECKDLITLCSACHRAIHMSPSNRNRFKFNDKVNTK